MNVIDMVLDKVSRDPMRIGFTSFTRAARREAAQRAADRFGVPLAQLEKDGWFRTLHSCAYRQLDIAKGELIAGGKDDNEWLRNAVGDETLTVGGSDDDDFLNLNSSMSDAGRALALWDVARNRLVPLEQVWEKEERWNSRIPPLDDCWNFVDLYEQAKKKDERLDFCDLLMKYSGRRWSGSHDAPFDTVEPDGAVYNLPVWIHDECQDASALTALVFKRLIAGSTYVYISGDHLQSVYSWSGSDSSIFMDWPVAKQKELPVSHRCRQNIVDLSWRLIAQDSRVGERGIFKGAHTGGEIDRTEWEDAVSSISASEDVLVLTRTNDYARRAARLLDDALVPWKPIKGGGGYAAPARVAGVMALVQMAKGEKVDGEAFWRILGLLPARADGVDLFVRGTKTDFEDKEYRRDLIPISLADCAAVGATAHFQELLASGRYKRLLEDQAAHMAAAAERHGLEAISQPKCRVGTIHASKGLEADRVVMLNKIPYPTKMACEDHACLAEERRLWYVGITRARHRVTIADDGGDEFEEL